MSASSPISKWTALWLSLALPGAGQLCARSITCVPWLLAAAGSWASVLWIGDFGGLIGDGAKVAVFACLGLASAEHAKRLCEPRKRRSAGWPRRVTSDPVRRRRIRAQITIAAPLAPEQLWRRVADL